MEVRSSLLYSAAHDDESEQQQSGTVRSGLYSAKFIGYFNGVLYIV